MTAGAGWGVGGRGGTGRRGAGGRNGNKADEPSLFQAV